MTILKLVFVFVLFADPCGAVVVHETVTYKSPVRKLSGRVVGYGNINPGVHVRLFDHPEVWSDDSLSVVQKRQRQREVGNATTDPTGKFEFRHIPKGAYELEFSTGDGGWNILSILLIVHPSGSREPLCVLMSMESVEQKPSVRVCHEHLSSLRDRIPPVDPETYRRIIDASNWKNPYLIVQPNGAEVRLNGAAERGQTIAVPDVIAYLERLPESTWVYGLVVAVTENGVVGSQDDASRTKRNFQELVQRLTEAGIPADLWPSA